MRTFLSTFSLLIFMAGCSGGQALDNDEALRPLRMARAKSIEATVNGTADCYLRDGDVTCWDGSIFMGSRKPRKIEGLKNPREIASDNWKTCVLEDGGTACWNVMPGDKKVIHEPSLGANQKSIALYGKGYCVLADEGLLCSYGATYDGSEENRPQLKNPRRLVGGGLLCALDDEGAKCWGRPFPDAGLPALIPFDGADEIVTYSQIVCLRRAKEVRCFGGGPYESLRRTAKTFSSSIADQVVIGMATICVLEKGLIRCDGPHQQYTTMPKFAYVSRLYGNGGALCALDDVGAHCWGPHPAGQLTRFRF